MLLNIPFPWFPSKLLRIRALSLDPTSVPNNNKLSLQHGYSGAPVKPGSVLFTSLQPPSYSWWDSKLDIWGIYSTYCCLCFFTNICYWETSFLLVLCHMTPYVTPGLCQAISFSSPITNVGSNESCILRNKGVYFPYTVLADVLKQIRKIVPHMWQRAYVFSVVLRHFSGSFDNTSETVITVD